MKKETIKVAYNNNYSGFMLSREAMTWMKENGYGGTFCSAAGECVVPRHHPVLVRCIEELGEKANGTLKKAGKILYMSDLRIAAIEGTRYYIVNYDGKETVIGENDLIPTEGNMNYPEDTFDPDNIWFTSDTHFYHANIIKFCGRPFKDVDEMNEELIRRWNETVPPNGIVFHLGDFAMGGSREWNNILYRLNGRIYLILGNHDMKNIKQGFMDRFERVTQQMTIRVGGQGIILNHNPFLCYGGAYRDVWQLFGHVHSGPLSGKVKEVDSSNGMDLPRLRFLFPNQYDVGVDNNDFRPVSFAEVKRIIEAQRKAAGGPGGAKNK